MAFSVHGFALCAVWADAGRHGVSAEKVVASTVDTSWRAIDARMVQASSFLAGHDGWTRWKTAVVVEKVTAVWTR